MIHASSPRSASNIGCTLLRSQHVSGSRSYRRGPITSACRSTVYSPTRSITLSPSRSVSCSLNASVSANWKPVSRNRIGMSGRICVAMCITIVPSAWKAEAIAIRSRPERSSAQGTISRGCASSNRSFSARSSSVWKEGLQRAALGCSEGESVCAGSLTPQAVSYAGRPATPNERPGNRPCPTSTRSLRTAEPSSTCSRAARRPKASAPKPPTFPSSRSPTASSPTSRCSPSAPCHRSPGFQGEADYHSVLDTMHLTNGLPWSIPVTLSVDDDGAHRLGGATAVALTAGEGGEPLAILRISEIYRRDKAKEAVSVYRTDDPEHPGVAAVQRRRRQVRRRRRSRCSRSRPRRLRRSTG